LVSVEILVAALVALNGDGNYPRRAVSHRAGITAPSPASGPQCTGQRNCEKNHQRCDKESSRTRDDWKREINCSIFDLQGLKAVKQQTTEKQGYGELQELVSLLNFFRIGLSLRISPIVKKKCNG